EVRSDSRGLPAGEVKVSWATPRDPGPAGVAGFLATIDGRPVPQSIVPAPAAPGDRVAMPLRDLGLTPGASVAPPVRAVAGARNEFMAFQVLIKGRNRDVTAALTLDGPGRPGARTDFGRYVLVNSRLGPLPDPIVPLGSPEDRGIDHGEATSQSLHAEVYVP